MYWFLVMHADFGAQARRARGRQGAQHRRGAVGRDGPARTARRSRHRCRARPGEDRPVPGLAGRRHQLRASRPRRDSKNGRSTGSGPTAWAPRWRSVAELEPLCSTSGVATGRNRPSTSHSARARHDRRAGDVNHPTWRPLRCAPSRQRRSRWRSARIARPRSGRRLFPPYEAGLVAELIRRDVPYYDPSIKPRTVESMNRFARSMGILQGDVPFEAVVATEL